MRRETARAADCQRKRVIRLQVDVCQLTIVWDDITTLHIDRLLRTSYCQYIDILGSGWDWNQTSTITYIKQAHTTVCFHFKQLTSDK